MYGLSGIFNLFSGSTKPVSLHIGLVGDEGWFSMNDPLAERSVSGYMYPVRFVFSDCCCPCFRFLSRRSRKNAARSSAKTPTMPTAMPIFDEVERPLVEDAVCGLSVAVETAPCSVTDEVKLVPEVVDVDEDCPSSVNLARRVRIRKEYIMQGRTYVK